jgi:hypothetical protein
MEVSTRCVLDSQIAARFARGLFAALGIMMKFLRWAMVAPASVLAWYVALVVGFMAASTLDYFCPADQMESGLCMAWWHVYAMDTLVVAFAAIAAFLVVLCATLVAPSHKLQVAWAAFGFGCAFAIYAVSQTSELVAFFAAVLSGLLSVFCVARFHGIGMLPNNAFKADVAKATRP